MRYQTRHFRPDLNSDRGPSLSAATYLVPYLVPYAGLRIGSGRWGGVRVEPQRRLLGRLVRGFLVGLEGRAAEARSISVGPLAVAVRPVGVEGRVRPGWCRSGSG